MNEYRLADLRYCPAIGENVIMQKVWRKGKEHLECLSKSECDFNKNGCQNTLLFGVEFANTSLNKGV